MYWGHEVKKKTDMKFQKKKQQLPSISMPLGTKGTDPVAIMMFLAVISLSGKPTFPYLTFCFPYRYQKQNI
jgi:hypothetical protein